MFETPWIRVDFPLSPRIWISWFFFLSQLWFPILVLFIFIRCCFWIRGYTGFCLISGLVFGFGLCRNVVRMCYSFEVNVVPCLKLREAVVFSWFLTNGVVCWGCLSLSICDRMGCNSQFLFRLFSFWFFSLVCLLVAELFVVAAGCDGESVTTMFAELCCAWRNLWSPQVCQVLFYSSRWGVGLASSNLYDSSSPFFAFSTYTLAQYW